MYSSWHVTPFLRGQGSYCVNTSKPQSGLQNSDGARTTGATQHTDPQSRSTRHKLSCKTLKPKSLTTGSWHSRTPPILPCQHLPMLSCLAPSHCLLCCLPHLLHLHSFLCCPFLHSSPPHHTCPHCPPRPHLSTLSHMRIALARRLHHLHRLHHLCQITMSHIAPICCLHRPHCSHLSTSSNIIPLHHLHHLLCLQVAMLQCHMDLIPFHNVHSSTPYSHLHHHKYHL
jgi:hypothetical protein